MQNDLTATRHLKPEFMSTAKLTQLQFETVSWQRLLDFMTDENIHHKNRLSEILKDRFDKNLLEEVDGFQNRFIRMDELIALLRHDHAEARKILQRETYADPLIQKKITGCMKKLRKNMITAEEQFGKLQSAFNHFLIENII
ncbi:MAG: hypothetical protein IPH68_14545 [Chitinophagaceae bacterium]|nr:hypothetical protein [Chitinophagaceae bacterium]MBK7556837.1 hypothetical protein [Chitinophagaceae bacterium]